MIKYVKEKSGIEKPVWVDSQHRILLTSVVLDGSRFT